MENNEKTLLQKAKLFAKKHKRGIVVGCITLGGITAGTLLVLNKNEIAEKLAKIKLNEFENVNNSPKVKFDTSEILVIKGASKSPHTRGMHIRNLSEGSHHSAENEKMASRLGIILKDNQSLIPEYKTGIAA